MSHTRDLRSLPKLVGFVLGFRAFVQFVNSRQELEELGSGLDFELFDSDRAQIVTAGSFSLTSFFHHAA